ncbi:serine protease 30-like [Gigantopelta aegis]|uniref:serine protease 30-like n=1 Tax=Gigantopelta aegis TaxID=1735272 RepID=UPI001B888967|nr:serine protease 30-like [Gigantopelta aegis]
MSSQIYSASTYLGSSLRIVGGNQAAECEFPWMAVIRDDIGRICAGSLIDNRHVITAGHCVERGLRQGSNMKVGLGSSSRRSRRMQYITAERVYRHPSYATNNNDIAVIRLSRAVAYSNCIQPICLATRPLAIPTGTVCLTSGWGLMKEGQGSAPDILQEVQVPIVSNAECSRSYSNIDGNKICAGFRQGGKDACQGDSGGPLACAFGRQWVMIGAVSFGLGCARPGFPGVYTYLPNYYSWIDRVRRS